VRLSPKPPKRAPRLSGEEERFMEYRNERLVRLSEGELSQVSGGCHARRRHRHHHRRLRRHTTLPGGGIESAPEVGLPGGEIQSAPDRGIENAP
jgi:hypothetical protein